MLRAWLVGGAVAALVLTGCGAGSTTEDAGTSPAADVSRVAETAQAEQAPSEQIVERREPAASAPRVTLPRASRSPSTLALGVTPNLKTKPVLRVRPARRPPRQLATRSVVDGTGAGAGLGDEVVMQYSATLWSSGKKVDSSWDHGMPLHFRIGDRGVAEGIDRGVRGMRAGERRLIVVPPSAGFAGSSSPAQVRADETLVYVLDLVRLGQGDPARARTAATESSSLSPVKRSR